MREEEFDRVVDSVKDVFKRYVPRHRVEVYFPEEDAWKRLVYRPVLMVDANRWIEAKAREMYGIGFTHWQKLNAYRRVFPYADSRLSGGEFFIAEGAFIYNGYFESAEAAEAHIVHEFSHANLVGKWGIANEAAEEMVKFYKTGEFEAGRRSHELSCKYNEFGEVFARFAELMYFDVREDKGGLEKMIGELRYHIGMGNKFWLDALQLFHLYKALGAEELMSRAKMLMETVDMAIVYPPEFDFIDFETIREGPVF